MDNQALFFFMRRFELTFLDVDMFSTLTCLCVHFLVFLSPFNAPPPDLWRGETSAALTYLIFLSDPVTVY